MLSEYKKGNYVIVGGDFNQCPCGLAVNSIEEPFDMEEFYTIPDPLFPTDWKCVFDSNTPTNRRVITPYEKYVTKVTVIDFFIIEPNVDILSIKCHALDFEFSDHNPIEASFKFKE